MDHVAHSSSPHGPNPGRARDVTLGYPEGMTTAELIAAKAKALSAEGQREVLDFVEFLHARGSRSVPRKSLAGAWSDLGIDLSADDIDEARRGAWSDFPRKDL
jgi:hypothetical protein